VNRAHLATTRARHIARGVATKLAMVRLRSRDRAATLCGSGPQLVAGQSNESRRTDGGSR
jgi:hypothetical protein